MDNIERQMYEKLSEQAINQNLFEQENIEDLEIENEIKYKNFSIPSFDEIAAKGVFNSIINVLNKNGEVVTEHKFGKLKSSGKYFAKLIFDTQEHSQIFLENESSENRLFPNVKIKHLEENILIGIYK